MWGSSKAALTGLRFLGWIRKLQYFSNSKDTAPLSTTDVKDFLTFNALLFFNREFGKIDGVVRAKRKPYIPVVLSREEIDAIVGNLKYPYNLVGELLCGYISKR